MSIKKKKIFDNEECKNCSLKGSSYRWRILYNNWKREKLRQSR